MTEDSPTTPAKETGDGPLPLQKTSVELGPRQLARRAEDGLSGFRRFYQMLGPGLITGASDDDPSGIITYAIAGATLGLATLWTALVTLPLMAGIQYVCAKIGMVSGTGLTTILRQHYSRRPLYIVLVGLIIANTINAGADIGAIASAINLLVPIPIFYLVIPVAVLILSIQILGSYRLIARLFKWLALTLLSYIGATILARPHWAEVIKATFIPPARFDNFYLLTLVAILGTTISPYLFFWQANQEVEEEISMGRSQLWERQGATAAEMKQAALDINVGMLFCNVVFYFVILGSATALRPQGITKIVTAADAAAALKPLAGSAASVLFALGIIGAGFLAVPVLTGSAAYAVSEAFGWEYGLDEKFGQAKQFYGVIAVSTAIGLLIDLTGVSPIRALFWSAVINGFIAPPLLAVIMMIANNKEVMGDRTNGVLTNLCGWVSTGLMFAAAIALILTWGN